MKPLRPRTALGILIPLCCGGCQVLGGVAGAGVQLIQLGLALAAMALPYAIWYYYNRHND